MKLTETQKRMLAKPNENLSWCKPFVVYDKEKKLVGYVVWNEGEYFFFGKSKRAIKQDGKLAKRLMSAVKDDADNGDYEKEKGCSGCPCFKKCDCMFD